MRQELLGMAMGIGVVLVLAGCAPRPTATPRPEVVPPAIPHTLVGRSECLLCHLTGIASSPAAPEYHRGLTNESCGVCHKPSARVVKATAQASPMATLPPTPSPPAAATPVATPSPTPRATAPARITHPLEGRADCLACHASGVPAIPQVPPDHKGRTNQTCTLCHLPK